MIRRFARSLFVLGAFVSVSSGASAQLAWTELRPVTSPPARYDHALKRIHPSFHVMLFGGRDATQAFADTWVWTGTNFSPAGFSRTCKGFSQSFDNPCRVQSISAAPPPSTNTPQ